MSERPKKLVVDCATNTTSEVELTDEEIEQSKKDAAAFAEFVAKREAEEQAQAAAKASAQAKLAALGLTPEEIAAL